MVEFENCGEHHLSKQFNHFTNSFKVVHCLNLQFMPQTENYQIENDIKIAETINSAFYSDPTVWEESKDKIFAKAWNYIGDAQHLLQGNTNVYPITLLEKYLEEPLILVQQKDGVKCFPNICTHRGFKLIQHPGTFKKMTCAYHGRRFSMDGKFEFMPEFKEVENFPRPCDNLTEVPLGQWANCTFTSVNPAMDFKNIHDILEKYLGFLPFGEFRNAQEYNEDYTVNAHWALYLENYLEGFHIPFVHNDLNNIIDYGKYATDVLDHVVVQTGYSDGSSPCFDLPEGHIDYGKSVTAYYIWAWPNFMINCYPWGIQYNVVKPITPKITRVKFIYYVWNQEIFDLMEATKLADKTEREDEFVVEAVQKGVNSRYYKSGRFSAKREKGVHYFQTLISKYLNQ